MAEPPCGVRDEDPGHGRVDRLQLEQVAVDGLGVDALERAVAERSDEELPLGVGRHELAQALQLLLDELGAHCAGGAHPRPGVALDRLLGQPDARLGQQGQRQQRADHEHGHQPGERGPVGSGRLRRGQRTAAGQGQDEDQHGGGGDDEQVVQVALDDADGQDGRQEQDGDDDGGAPRPARALLTCRGRCPEVGHRGMQGGGAQAGEARHPQQHHGAGQRPGAGQGQHAVDRVAGQLERSPPEQERLGGGRPRPADRQAQGQDHQDQVQGRVGDRDELHGRCQLGGAGVGRHEEHPGQGAQGCCDDEDIEQRLPVVPGAFPADQQSDGDGVARVEEQEQGVGGRRHGEHVARDHGLQVPEREGRDRADLGPGEDQPGVPVARAEAPDAAEQGEDRQCVEQQQEDCARRAAWDERPGGTQHRRDSQHHAARPQRRRGCPGGRSRSAEPLPHRVDPCRHDRSLGRSGHRPYLRSGAATSPPYRPANVMAVVRSSRIRCRYEPPRGPSSRSRRSAAHRRPARAG
ncbi:hypothetical protein BH24ACT10_BH24ACT10_01520 [soil metagenome]